MGQQQPWDRQAVHDEFDRVQADFHQLLDQATRADLARRTDGTRWTNEQLLFHMLFGYIIVRALLPLAAVFGRLPSGASRGYARLLNAATRPFDLINYLGPCAAIHVYGHQRMAAKLDRVLAALHRRLDAATPADLARGMHYPIRWDPFFNGYMTLADLFRYPTRHYDFHRRQLTLTAPVLSRAATARLEDHLGHRAARVLAATMLVVLSASALSWAWITPAAEHCSARRCLSPPASADDSTGRGRGRKT